MGELTPLDLVIFFGSLLGIMGVGLWAGRKEDTSEDFYLAGRGMRWWGVAGSIFGSNVSANHIVGMMGVGYAVGFAQSHFEITAIAGLLLLCYAFLPVYRKLGVFTLSEYLGRRYNDASRLAYALIMIVIMVAIQMVPAFYIGSRSLNLLLSEGTTASIRAEVNTSGAIARIVILNGGRDYVAAPVVEVDTGSLAGVKSAQAEAVVAERPVVAIGVTQPGQGYSREQPPEVVIEGDAERTAQALAIVTKEGFVSEVVILDGGAGYTSPPAVRIAPPPAGDKAQAALARANLADRAVSRVDVTDGGASFDAQRPPAVTLRGGASFDPQLSPGDVDPRWYFVGILLMALVTGTYTIVGGLKAVIITDVIQSVLLLLAGLLIAFFTFAQVGWWPSLAARDAGDAQLMHLYKPMNHGELPWTGVLSGLMVLHFFYWGANQFIVQRALAARSDREARFGIISAGFFKLLIPFFSIGTGIAAYYLFKDRGMSHVAQDAVFTRLLIDLIRPVGFGLVGLVAAGVIGAILSSLDSMMNSSATLVTFDVYKRYVQPDAPEKTLVWIGRLFIALFITGAVLLTIFTMDPNSKDSFFLQIADHQGRLVAGVVVAFLLGMIWSRATEQGAIVAIIAGIAVSYGLPPFYDWIVAGYKIDVVEKGHEYIGFGRTLVDTFGERLNFFHAVFVAALVSLGLHVGVSLLSKPNEEQAGLTWRGLELFKPGALRATTIGLIVSLAVYALLAVAMIPWNASSEVNLVRSSSKATGLVTPTAAASIAAGWTWLMFLFAARRAIKSDGRRKLTAATFLSDDLVWAGLLAAAAVFMMFYFY